MARFVSISLVLVVMNSMFVFGQKYEPVPMCMFVQETPSLGNELHEIEEAEESTSLTINIYNNYNSNYLTLEVLGSKQTVPFQLLNTQGEEMYSGTIRGTQLIETESWSAGTYYLLCGPKRETLYIMK